MEVLKKILYAVIVWGKPLIRERIKERVVPALKEEIKKVVTTKTNQEKVFAILDQKLDELNKKYL